MKLLLDNGANLAVTDNRGNPLLSIACLEGKPNVVNFLLDLGMNFAAIHILLP